LRNEYIVEFEDEDVSKVSKQGEEPGEDVVARMKMGMVRKRKRKLRKQRERSPPSYVNKTHQGNLNDESHRPLQQ